MFSYPFSRLAQASRLGSYLLRDGTHADAEKVGICDCVLLLVCAYVHVPEVFYLSEFVNMFLCLNIFLEIFNMF